MYKLNQRKTEFALKFFTCLYIHFIGEEIDTHKKVPKVKKKKNKHKGNYSGYCPLLSF